MNECSLGVHQVKLVIETRPCLRYRCCVWKHAHSTLELCEIRSGNHSWRLVIDTNLKKTQFKDKGDAIRGTLKPVGHQSTNCIERFVLTEAIAALTSFGTTSPRNRRQHAWKHSNELWFSQNTGTMYFPLLGSHFTIWAPGSKHCWVISATWRQKFEKSSDHSFLRQVSFLLLYSPSSARDKLSRRR